MTLSVELYEDRGIKMVFIAADDGASGAEYPYKNAEDIGKNIAFYLSNYYPDVVANPTLGTTIRVTDIQWDADDEEDVKHLPTAMFVPAWMDDEEIGNYITEMTGFCHKGFVVETDD